MRQALLRTSMLCGPGLTGRAAPVAGLGWRQAGGGRLLLQRLRRRPSTTRTTGQFWQPPATCDALKHDAEVYFKGETTLDNGLTLGAADRARRQNDADQIDKSWFWSGGFGVVRIGSQNDALENQCPSAARRHREFQRLQPDRLGLERSDRLQLHCFSADNDSQKILYISPSFSGFQLAVSYTPSANAEDYAQAGVNGAGTPSNPDGTAHSHRQRLCHLHL